MNIAILGTLTGLRPSAWSIDSISKLLWLDASDSETVTESEGKVSAWNDKSGNSRHVSQGTADYQPTISDNKITFDGIDDRLTNSSPFMWAAGNVAVFAVMSAPGVGGAYGIVESSTLSNNPCYSLCGRDSGDGRVFMRHDGSSTLGFVTELIPKGEWDNSLHVSTLYDRGTILTGYLDGTFTATDHATYSRSGTTLTLNAFTIGGWLRTSFVAPMDITIGELIVTTYEEGVINRPNIEEYLANKWGVSIAGMPTGIGAYEFADAPVISASDSESGGNGNWAGWDLCEETYARYPTDSAFWVKLDLGASKYVQKVRFRGGPDTSVVLTLEHSTDDSSWTSIYSGPGVDTYYEISDWITVDSNVRYFKFSKPGPNYSRFYYFEVVGTY